MSQPLAESIGAAPQPHAMRIGVVVTTDPPTVSIQDGEAVPVGVLQGVWLRIGAPVVVLKQGQTWLALGEPGELLGGPLPNSNIAQQFGMPTSTTTSASFVPLTSPPVLTLTKRYSYSRIFLTMHTSAYASGGDAGPQWGLRVNGSLDVAVASLLSTNATNGVRQSASGSAMFNWPAGSLSMLGIWRRANGAGTATCDINDTWSCIATEVIP